MTLAFEFVVYCAHFRLRLISVSLCSCSCIHSLLTVAVNKTLQCALDALKNWSEKWLLNLNITNAKSYPLVRSVDKCYRYTIRDCNNHTILIEGGIQADLHGCKLVC